MITAPFPWATTAVFKPMAPTNTNMASKITESLRDIVPPRWDCNPPGAILTLCTPMSSSSGPELVLYRYTPPCLIVSLGVRLSPAQAGPPIPHTILFSTAWRNSTIVLSSLVRSSYAYAVLPLFKMTLKWEASSRSHPFFMLIFTCAKAF